MNIFEKPNDIQQSSEMFSQVVTACQELLHTPIGADAKQYIQGRLSNYSIDKYRIGYFPNNKNLSLLTQKVDRNILAQLQLIYPVMRRGRGMYYHEDNSIFNNNNLIIPFYNEYGNIIALAGRTLLSHQERKDLSVSKYKNSVYTKSLHLFGLDKAQQAITQNNCAIIVEGQLDCISCHANGIFNVVAMTGGGLSVYQMYLLKKMTNRIYLLLDNDEAGQKAKNKIIQNYSKDIEIFIIELPPTFKDVDNYLRESNYLNIFDSIQI